MVTRWSQGGHKVVNKQGRYNLATTLLHACKHRCIDQYTSHAKQPCFKMVKESQVYFTCKTTMFQDGKIITEYVHKFTCIATMYGSST